MNDLERFFKQNLYYDSALKILETELEIVRNELTIFDDGPINHIKTRIKSFDSIIAKMKKKNLPLNFDSIDRLSDIVGARIVCNFLDDIYLIIKSLRNNTNFKIIEEKDYIKSPKASGYRGYHIIVLIPVCIDSITKNIKAEIQIRTTAMDFWATNEHKLNYKINNNSKKVRKQLLETSKTLWNMDIMMNDIYKKSDSSKKRVLKGQISNVMKTNCLKYLDGKNEIYE